MRKQILHLVFLIIPFLCYSQEYVDLAVINYSKSGETSFKNRTENTSITTFETHLTVPVILNKNYIVITGIDFGSMSLQLFPNSSNNHLIYTSLKAGVKINYSEHWSGLYVIFPKIASDYIKISKEDFYLAGVVMLKYKRDKNFGYGLGLYTATEAFGLYMTPIISFYYHSPNSRFEINLNLPSTGDLNYSLTDKTKIGLDYASHGNSFKQTTDNIRSTYVENSTTDFSSYLQNNSFSKNLLLRLKIGVSTNIFQVFPIDQKVDLEIPGIKFGDKRTQLNTDLSSSIFAKIEAIYRFDLGTDKK